MKRLAAAFAPLLLAAPAAQASSQTLLCTFDAGCIVPAVNARGDAGPECREQPGMMRVLVTSHFDDEAGAPAALTIIPASGEAMNATARTLMSGGVSFTQGVAEGRTQSAGFTLSSSAFGAILSLHTAQAGFSFTGACKLAPEAQK